MKKTSFIAVISFLLFCCLTLSMAADASAKSSVKEVKTSKLAHIKTKKARIYQRNFAKSKAAGSSRMNKVYYIKRTTKFKGAKYDLISTKPSSAKGVLGWVKNSDLTTHTHKGVDKKSKTFTVKGSGPAYVKAWGGKQDIAYKSLKNYKNKTFKVNLTEKVGNNIWYRGKLGKKTVWIHSSHVAKPKKTSKTTKASGAYAITASALNIRSGAGATYKKVGTLHTGDIVHVNAKSKNGWYRFKYKNKNAYASGSYLRKVSSTATEIAKTKTAKKADQIVAVVGTGSKAYVEYWVKGKNNKWSRSFSTNGHVGSKGVGKTKEGLSKTPQGAYKLGFAFGTSNPGTKKKFRKVTKNSYWISNVKDAKYNTWQERKKSSKVDEHLIDYPTSYQYGIVINYNTTKPKKGAGSAFFLHVDNGKPTGGCVSITKSKMKKLMVSLKNKSYIIQVGNQKDIKKY